MRECSKLEALEIILHVKGGHSRCYETTYVSADQWINMGQYNRCAHLLRWAVNQDVSWDYFVRHAAYCGFHFKSSDSMTSIIHAINEQMKWYERRHTLSAGW